MGYCELNKWLAIKGFDHFGLFLLLEKSEAKGYIFEPSYLLRGPNKITLGNFPV